MKKHVRDIALALVGVIVVGMVIGKAGVNSAAATDGLAYVDNTDWQSVFSDLLTGEVTYNPSYTLTAATSQWVKPGEEGWVDSSVTTGEHSGDCSIAGRTKNISDGNWNRTNGNYAAYYGPLFQEKTYESSIDMSRIVSNHDTFLEQYGPAVRSGLGWYGYICGNEFVPGVSKYGDTFGYMGGRLAFFKANSNVAISQSTDPATVEEIPYWFGLTSGNVKRGMQAFSEYLNESIEANLVGVELVQERSQENYVVYGYRTARLGKCDENITNGVKLMNGLQYGSTIQEVMEVYGTPDYGYYNRVDTWERQAYAGFHSLISYIDSTGEYVLDIEFVDNKLSRVQLTPITWALDPTTQANWVTEVTDNILSARYTTLANDLWDVLMTAFRSNTLGAGVTVDVPEITEAKADEIIGQQVSKISCVEYCCNDRVLNRMTVNGKVYQASTDVGNADMIAIIMKLDPYKDVEDETQRKTAVELKVASWGGHDFSEANAASFGGAIEAMEMREAMKAAMEEIEPLGSVEG